MRDVGRRVCAFVVCVDSKEARFVIGWGECRGGVMIRTCVCEASWRASSHGRSSDGDGDCIRPPSPIHPPSSSPSSFHPTPTTPQKKEPTIGAAFLTQAVVLEDSTVKFEIWDTAGQERYRSLAPMYYRGASAAIVVYDITNAESFKGESSWFLWICRTFVSNTCCIAHWVLINTI